MKWKEILAAAAIGTVFATAISWAISPPFATSWGPGYEAIPADTEQESLGASRIRDLKFQLRLRMQQDHSWAGDGNDGFHNQVTLLQQSTDPAPGIDLGKTAGIAYTKLVGSRSELFYKDSTGVVTQITNQGQLVNTVPSGTVLYTASSTIPGGYDACDGTAHSRTSESALFAAIGTTYGAGDGSTTFNVPDGRGRSLFGFDSANATGRLTAASTGGISAAALGNNGGQQNHTLTVAEMPSHNHGVTDPGHTHLYGSGSGGASTPSTLSNANGNGVLGFTSSSNTTGISINNIGGSGAHNVTPPGLVLNCIIKQ